MSFRQDHPIEYGILCEYLGEPTGVCPDSDNHFPGWGKKDHKGWFAALVIRRDNQWKVVDIDRKFQICRNVYHVINTVMIILNQESIRELSY